MEYIYNFDGSKESFRGAICSSSVEHESIESIEIIINGKSFLVVHSSPLSDMKVFDFRVGTHDLVMAGDHLIKENK